MQMPIALIGPFRSFFYLGWKSCVSDGVLFDAYAHMDICCSCGYDDVFYNT